MSVAIPPSTSLSDTADRSRKVIDQYRSTAKWVVSSFGAVAGAVAVGVQFSSLGELKGSHLWWAAISLAVLFLAIIAVIASAARVLLPVRLTYKRLATGRKFKPLRRAMVEEESRELTDVTKELEEEVAEVDRAIADTRKARAALKSKKTPENEAALAAARQVKTEWNASVTERLWRGRTTYTEHVFACSMVTVVAALIAAAIAASGFAYASGSSTKATSTVTNVHVSFSEAKAKPGAPSATNVHLTVNEPKTCVDLYLALDELARAKPNIGSHWPTISLGKQDHACGFHIEKELAHFLSFLAQH